MAYSIGIIDARNEQLLPKSVLSTPPKATLPVEHFNIFADHV